MNKITVTVIAQDRVREKATVERPRYQGVPVEDHKYIPLMDVDYYNRKLDEYRKHITSLREYTIHPSFGNVEVGAELVGRISKMVVVRCSHCYGIGCDYCDEGYERAEYFMPLPDDINPETGKGWFDDLDESILCKRMPTAAETAGEETFEDFMRNSRDAFVTTINEQKWDTQLRTAAEDFLICFDQMRERLQHIESLKNTEK